MLNPIISLCDYSGAWSLPWAEAGHPCYLVDPKYKTAPMEGLHPNQLPIGSTAEEYSSQDLLPENVHMVLMAPPCTHFSVSGAQYWKVKDANGKTADAMAIVEACLRVVDRVGPVYWCLENPVGRIPTLFPGLGRPVLYFQPHDFAGWADDPESERYTKKTGLWGRFNADLTPLPLEPIRYCKQGSWLQQLGGSSEKTKELRSKTPQGFSRAFHDANKSIAMPMVEQGNARQSALQVS